MRSIAKAALLVAIALAAMVTLVAPVDARLKVDRSDPGLAIPKIAAVGPYTTLRVHNVGNFYLSVTNWGFFGSRSREEMDPCTGLPAPGAEFPAGSTIDYLFQGALWMGALVGYDTLTSVGHDGWQRTTEMYPETLEKGGDIIGRTNRPGVDNVCGVSSSPDAVSEQDFIAVYTDTLTDQQYVPADPFTGPHVPLYVKITQKSYAWSYTYAQDFVLLDFIIENIGLDSLRKLYMGLYIDADVYHITRGTGFSDDICGYRKTVRSPSGAVPCRGTAPLQDTINIAWIADNDGDPVGGIFDYRSPDAVTGTRVVRSPTPPGGCGPTPLDYSFNWWISNGDTRFDWSPQHLPGDMNFSGAYGTPDGDMHKYRYMSNGEFDYDQVFAAIDYQDSTSPAAPQGWIPPSKQANDLANGYDTRYLLSFGPFDIAPGDSLPVTVGYIAGERFHFDPENVKNLPDRPNEFYAKLDFTDLAVNAQWAAWVFDNPGFDTPDPQTKLTDGCRGLYVLANCRSDTVIDGVATCLDCDTVWYAGDGIPDYKGPPPPSSPAITITTTPGKVVIEWDGEVSELTADPFSFLNDFEGYRVYMADQNQVANFALLASWDKIDYRPFREDTTQPEKSPKRWAYKEHPLTLDELREQFTQPSFDPLQYPSSVTLYRAPDGQRYYFEPEDWNRGDSYLERGVTVYNNIQRVGTGERVDTVGGVEVRSYYGRYRYEISGLLPSQSYYFAVTAFDYGYPQNGLEPLESSPLANSRLAFPFYSANVVEDSNLQVTVFPNPYKISDDYRGSRYEDQFRRGWTERDRRLHFVNLPSRATIKIFTLDGDLVREILHEPGGTFSESTSGAWWDLISKNTQAVVSGIYLYSVESALGTQVGKIVIIK